MKKRVVFWAGLPLVVAGVFVFGLLLRPGYEHLPPPPNDDTAETTDGQSPLTPTPPSEKKVAKATQRKAGDQFSPRDSGLASVVQERLEDGRVLSINGVRYPLRVYKTLMTPNDPAAQQWWLGATGLPAAWDITPGPYTPTVAIIDTGFALEHEEFADRWYRNVRELGTASTEGPSDLNCSDQGLPLDASCNNIDDEFDGIVDNETGPTTIQNPSWRNCSDRGLPLDRSCNQIDDDGNGLKDDVTGWDFSNFDRSVQAGEVSPAGTDTTHGTMVAGVFGATGNNGRGIAGVNWSAKILPLQAIDDDGYGDTLTVARSVRYAADQGADIISLSLGTGGDDPYLRESIAYAHGKGSLVVAASGNDGCDCMLYPARYAEVLAVGASNANGSPAAFSSYGANLDLLAPGQDITAPTWTSTNQTDAYASGIAGTSFATPYASGLLALARSHQPSASWGEVLAVMLEQADHRTLTAIAPHSSTFGYGFVRADRTLTRVTTPARNDYLYRFSPLTQTDLLATARVQSCSGSTLPSTPFFEATRNGEVRYTASPHQLYLLQRAGWATRYIAHGCIGLPFDTSNRVRTINLLSEIRNLTPVKPL